MALTLRRLHDVLDYDPDTGAFTWRITLSNRRPAGSPAGCWARGYLKIAIDDVTYPASRLAVFFMTGVFPTIDVDHLNGRPAENWFDNLRVAGPLINAQNRRLPSKNNGHGFLGIHFCRSTNRWRATIMVNWKKRCLGRFDTPEEAHAAYVTAKRKLHLGNTL